MTEAMVSRRDGGIFLGNLKSSIDEVRLKLEKKIVKAARLWFMERNGDIRKQIIFASSTLLLHERDTISTCSVGFGRFHWSTRPL